MKKGNIKIAAILAGVSLILLTGCGNKAQEAAGVETQTEITAAVTEQAPVEDMQTQTPDPETPDYAYCLHITINPEFRLYLDEQSKVLAEPCGRPAAPVTVPADRPVLAVEEAVWMPRMALPADIAVAPVVIPASSAAAQEVSPAASAMARA